MVYIHDGVQQRTWLNEDNLVVNFKIMNVMLVGFPQCTNACNYQILWHRILEINNKMIGKCGSNLSLRKSANSLLES